MKLFTRKTSSKYDTSTATIYTAQYQSRYIPNPILLAQLIRSNEGRPPLSSACFDLLFFTWHGNFMNIYCNGCMQVSRYSLTTKGTDYQPIYACEYSFCRYEIPLVIPYLTGRSKLSVAHWIILFNKLSIKADTPKDALAKELGVSWPTIDMMIRTYERLSKR